jgi:pseudouridine-5'-phosphate glycosidase
MLVLSPEIIEALKNNQPIVALESTILAHGMPYPDNIEMAQSVDAIIRKEGAIPATAAVIDGELKLGLTEQETERLAREQGVMKLSRRDIPYAVATKKTGATTVAATMIIAEMAGVEVFVTGGIGGVHRDVADSWDISADLTELSKTDVTVVCAGVKSILDIPRTLEYLETMGVPVVGFGTEVFPAFYYRDSGCSLSQSAVDAKAAAEIIMSKRILSLQGGIVVANPIPKAEEADKEEIERVIIEALKMAETEGVRGKDLTPFLLDKVKSLTEGRSLEANLALVRNNAKVGAQIACALSS